VRQVLDQELQRTHAQRDAQARQARFFAGATSEDLENPVTHRSIVLPTRDQENLKPSAETVKSTVKRDFFGRIVEVRPLQERDVNSLERRPKKEEHKVWVTYHEGLNNAVRKPISLQEFLGGL
jgi:chromosome transmission fidelity protein 18